MGGGNKRRVTLELQFCNEVRTDRHRKGLGHCPAHKIAMGSNGKGTESTAPVNAFRASPGMVTGTRASKRALSSELRSGFLSSKLSAA
mmetsp:Transcript_36954/g.147395  ORF Transcript_36954/g.147395 Transcript_36954/m.147395 type:complete len:88 (+) Transcript_36954:485-748(+)